MKRMALVLLLAVLLAGCGIESEGTRRGKIIKLSNKGWFLPRTWEAEMALEGLLTGESGTSGYIWEFTVPAEISDEAQRALESGEIVEVKYRDEVIAAPWRSRNEGNYFATEIKQKDH